jgi:DNA-binding ferritin-like protein (oxidative damage protectant)
MPTAAKLQTTKNDLPYEVRQNLVQRLNAVLAQSIDLAAQAKQAHWNVRGPNFFSLHELFDKAAGEIAAFSDDLAERVVQLGGIAEGTIQAVGRASTLPEYPLDLTTGSGHVEALSSALAAFGRTVRESIDYAAKLNDADTADLFTEISRAVDKLLWFLEAHQQ